MYNTIRITEDNDRDMNICFIRKGLLMKKTIIAITLISASWMAVPAEAAPSPQNLTAKSAIVIEASTGEVLYEKNARERRYPASTTKIMTIITALEAGNTNDVVTVGASAANTEGSSMGLAPDEKIKLEDLLYGLALVSGNDAAVAIAEHISGSVGKFAGLMTDKARKIGAVRTHFTNSSGLPDSDHYTTADDLARIAAYGYKNPKFAEIVGTVLKEIPRAHSRGETYYNENKLLQIYNGANGVKTGYTEAAGRCLVAAAKRGNIQLITVVLDADYMFTDSMNLLDYGFSQLQEKMMVYAGEFVDKVQVVDGKADAVNAVASESLFIPFTPNSRDAFRTVVEIEKTVSAPVAAGQKVGVVKVLYQDKEVASTDVVLTETVNRQSLLAKIKEFLTRLLLASGAMSPFGDRNS